MEETKGKLKIISTTDPDFDKKTEGDREFIDTSFWYLHGELEKHFGYDKAYLTGELPDSLFKRIPDPTGDTEDLVDCLSLEGVYDVEVIGTVKEAIGYFWTTPCGTYKTRSGVYAPMWTQRGLVVFKDDHEAIEYAERKFIEKPGRL